MSPAPASARGGPSSRSASTGRVGCAAYVLGLCALAIALDIVQSGGLLCTIVFWLILFAVATVIRIRRIHRRGLTVPEALAQGRADRRRRAELLRRARHEAARLPWLNDRKLSPADTPGVLITPAPQPPGCYVSGHDVRLDCAGDRPILVIRQVRKLTRLPLKEAKDLVDRAPVALLRLPDIAMASATQCLLESAGATASITEPGSA